MPQFNNEQMTMDSSAKLLENFQQSVKILEGMVKKHLLRSNIYKEVSGLNRASSLAFENIEQHSHVLSYKILALELTEILNKINNVIGEDYYLNIISNADFWDEPKERMLQVKHTVIKITVFIIEKMQELNAENSKESLIIIEKYSKINGEGS